MSDKKAFGIEDFLPAHASNGSDAYDGEPKILLRIVEGARVAIIKDTSMAEILPTRGDLFNYAGGYAWGYGGSGPLNLAHAIAGKVFDLDGLDRAELSRRAHRILSEVVALLDGDVEHDIEIARLVALFEDVPKAELSPI